MVARIDRHVGQVGYLCPGDRSCVAIRIDDLKGLCQRS